MCGPPPPPSVAASPVRCRHTLRLPPSPSVAATPGCAGAMANQVRGLTALRQLAGSTYTSRGLQDLGLREESHRSVLHLWARRLPRGMFDGHRCVMPAPDDLSFHGLTKRLVIGLFDLLSDGQRQRVGLSVREAMAHSHPPSTKIYNEKRKSIVSVRTSEWAATLTILSFAFRRELRTSRNPDHNEQSISPLQAELQVVDAFTILINALYYYPRVEVDGEKACRDRATPQQIKKLGDHFFSLVVAACLRGDTAAFGRRVDVPNLHRLGDLLDHVIPLLLHIRHVQELLFENAHHPIKRAIGTGNGRNEAERGLERIRQGKLASRILLEPLHFGDKPEWLEHRGVQPLLKTARPL